MKIASWILATLYFAVVALLLSWGAWLLATDDPDGGRHPVGAVMFITAGFGGALGVVSIRRLRRR